MGTGKNRPDFFLYRGDSMRMVFRPGDKLLMDDCGFEELENGDVVCFTGENDVQVVHRLVGKSDGITWGDNNLHPDKRRLEKANFIGRVAWRDSVSGGKQRIAGGKRGMVLFFIHQRRLHLRRLASILLNPAKTLLRAAVWRCGGGRAAFSLETFGCRKVLLWHGRIIAGNDGRDGKLKFRRGTGCFFDVKRLEAEFGGEDGKGGGVRE